jgi:anti-sigma B factor antagonist
MSVSEREAGPVTIVTLSGNLTQGAAGDGLRDKVGSLLQQGRKDILVDLGAVPYMDSSGLGTLVAAYTTAQRQGGSLKLLNLTKRLHDLLVITKLANVFDCFEDETTAVSSFSRSV